MSIRLRLTFWYVGLLAVLLALFGSFLYILFERNLVEEWDRSLDEQAKQQAVEIRRAIEASQQSMAPFLPPVNVFTTNEIFVQLLDATGNILTGSPNLGEQRIPIDPGFLAQVARQGSNYTNVQTEWTLVLPDQTTVRNERVSLRVYALPIRLQTENRVIGYIVTARSLRELELTMAQLRQVLVIVSGLTLVIAFVIGTLLAQRALRPIDRITTTARKIGISGNLRDRVRYRGPRDEIGRLVATFNDMLDRLAEAARKQEDALAAQRRFVADASHELRTPLTTVRGNLDLLARHPELTAADREEALQDALSESRRMSRLVEDLLFLARVDSGQRLTLAPLQADEVLREVIRQARRLGPDHIIEAGPIAPATINGSADHFRQLLLVLLDNAIKYTPIGGRIRLETRVTIDPPTLVVHVSDTGRGISPEALPHIFDRFYRADPARGGAGAGLGLAIARWLAEEHNGRITVQSELGVGSTFSIWLPALRVTPPTPPFLAAQPARAASAPTPAAEPRSVG